MKALITLFCAGLLTACGAQVATTAATGAAINRANRVKSRPSTSDTAANRSPSAAHVTTLNPRSLVAVIASGVRSVDRQTNKLMVCWRI